MNIARCGVYTQLYSLGIICGLLAAAEFIAVQARFKQLFVKSLLGYILYCGIDNPAQFIKTIGLNIAEHKVIRGILYTGVAVGLRIAAKPALHKRALNGGGLGIEKRIGNYFHCAYLPHAAVVNYPAAHIERLALGVVARVYGICLCYRFRRGQLCGVANVLARGGRVFIKIAVRKGKHPVQIHIAIQAHERIGRMVKLFMKVAERFIGKLRYNGRVAAGVHAVGIIEQRGIYLLRYHPVGSGESPLHLVVNNAVYAKLAVVYFIMPAFLPEYFGHGMDKGIEHRIHININKVKIILHVLARYGIHCPVACGEGIEESVERTLHQLHKRLPHGVFVAARKHAVLQYVWHARAVFGRGAKAHCKGLVGIRAVQMHHCKAAFIVLINIGRAFYFFKFA